jgi:hypothetical protein
MNYAALFIDLSFLLVASREQCAGLGRVFALIDLVD